MCSPDDAHEGEAASPFNHKSPAGRLVSHVRILSPPVKRSSPISELKERRPAAVSQWFTVRLLRGATKASIRVMVPVRVQAAAARRNRIRRQVGESFRRVLKGATQRVHLLVSVRQADIPQGDQLNRMVFELARELGMIEPR